MPNINVWVSVSVTHMCVHPKERARHDNKTKTKEIITLQPLPHHHPVDASTCPQKAQKLPGCDPSSTPQLAALILNYRENDLWGSILAPFFICIWCSEKVRFETGSAPCVSKVLAQMWSDNLSLHSEGHQHLPPPCHTPGRASVECRTSKAGSGRRLRPPRQHSASFPTHILCFLFPLGCDFPAGLESLPNSKAHR